MTSIIIRTLRDSHHHLHTQCTPYLIFYTERNDQIDINICIFMHKTALA